MSNVENVCPQVLGGVAREVRRLAARPPPGVKLALRDDDLTDIVALIEGPAETPYAGGVFRVRLVLGREFPAAPPRAVFLTRIFHPNVSAAGEVCVNTLRRDWRPELGLSHALLALRCLLIAPNHDSALNADAAALLRDHYDRYFARAKLYTEIHAMPHKKEGEASCEEKAGGARSRSRSRSADRAERGPEAAVRGPDTAERGPDTAERGPDTAERGLDAAERGPDAAERGPGPAVRGPETGERGQPAPRPEPAPHQLRASRAAKDLKRRILKRL